MFHIGSIGVVIKVSWNKVSWNHFDHCFENIEDR
jgi:hypothetical protein